MSAHGSVQSMPPDVGLEIMLIILCCALVATLIVGVFLILKSRKEERTLHLPIYTCFSRKRTPAPLTENVSVVMSQKLKEELILVSGGQQSKYIRACVRLALPVLKAHPSLIDILEKE